MNVARGECAKELRLLHVYNSFDIYMYNSCNSFDRWSSIYRMEPLRGYLWQEIGEERSHRRERGKTALTRHFLLNSENYPTN